VGLRGQDLANGMPAIFAGFASQAFDRTQSPSFELELEVLGSPTHARSRRPLNKTVRLVPGRGPLSDDGHWRQDCTAIPNADTPSASLYSVPKFVKLCREACHDDSFLNVLDAACEGIERQRSDGT
jgi:hypothetical protein